MKYKYLALWVGIGWFSLGFQSTSFKSIPTENEKLIVENGLWLDLVTPDLATSKSFYESLFGWTFTESSIGELKNLTINHNGNVIGSLFEIPNAEQSVWIASAKINAAELTSKSNSLVNAGAKIAIGPIDIPGRGQQILFEGSQGEEFSLIVDNAFVSPTKKSNGSWMGAELWASDIEKAKTFYENAFGVQTRITEFDGMPYWFFESQGEILAGMTQNPVTNQGTRWVPYVYSSDLVGLVINVEKSGGKVLVAPSENLRNGNLAICLDPNGAVFCVQSLN